MKFLLDEHLNPAVASGLENRGYEATTILGQELTSLEDRKILEYAFNNEFVIVTNDDDFLSLIDDVEHEGIVFVTNQELRVSNIISEIAEKVSQVEDMENTVLYV
jgi:predicted nuclease of predicted toxin-antitoxin system